MATRLRRFALVVAAALALTGCAIAGSEVADTGPAQGYLDQLNSWVRHQEKTGCTGEGGKTYVIDVTVWTENTEHANTARISQNTVPARGDDAVLWEGELQPKKKDGNKYNNFQPKENPGNYKTVRVELQPNGPDPKNNKADLRQAQIRIVDLHSRVKSKIEVFKKVFANDCPRQSSRNPGESKTAEEEAHDRRVCAERSTPERERACLERRGLVPLDGR